MSSPTLEATMPLRLEIDGGVARLTLDRPETRNALSRDLLDRIGQALRRVASDASVRAVVLAAEGTAFCSGHDLRELADASPADLAALFSACALVMRQLRTLPQPVIARVQGPAVAAGCQLVAACDLAVAAAGASFSTPDVTLGLFCTTPMVPLVRTVPPKAALEMLLTGTPISAERALELGLVNRVVPPQELDAAVRQLTDTLLAASNAGQPDAREGIAAFLQKRRPAWTQDDFGPLPTEPS